MGGVTLEGMLAKDTHNKIMINLQVFDWSRNKEWVPYDPSKHGCIPLGNFHRRNSVEASFLEGTSTFHALTEGIKFPSIAVREIGRTDMDTRVGRIHMTNPRQLIHRNPVNGNNYQCVMMILPTYIAENAMLDQRKCGRPPALP